MHRLQAAGMSAYNRYEKCAGQHVHHEGTYFTCVSAWGLPANGKKSLTPACETQHVHLRGAGLLCASLAWGSGMV